MSAERGRAVRGPSPPAWGSLALPFRPGDVIRVSWDPELMDAGLLKDEMEYLDGAMIASQTPKYHESCGWTVDVRAPTGEVWYVPIWALAPFGASLIFDSVGE